MRLLDLILNVLYPKYCLLCLREGLYICARCKTLLQYYNGPCCPVCKGLLRSQKYFIHKICKKHSNLDGLFPLIHYDCRSKIILGEAKYKYAQEVLVEIADMLKPIYSNLPFKIDYLVPVPLSREKKNYRGFNQSEVIAKAIGWKYKNILQRLRDTKSQAISNRSERITNLKNAFIIDPFYKIKDKNIVLIDDVYTTGSTLEECAKILKEAGASKVVAVVWAKD